MPLFFRENKAVASLLLLSVLLMAAFAMGLFEKEINLLDENEVYTLKSLEAGNAVARLERQEDNALFSNCDMPGSIDIGFCGILIELTGDRTTGLDLRQYEKLNIKFTIEAPLDTSELRISFRTYNKRYSIIGNDQSFKYNSIVITPERTSEIDLSRGYVIDNIVGDSVYEDAIKILSQSPTADDVNATFVFDETIAMSFLRVDDWWIAENKISVKDSLVDLSNIPYIDIMHTNTSTKGVYQIRFETLTLHGEGISIEKLFAINSFIFGLVIYFLIRKQKSNLIALSTVDVLTGLMNRRGLSVWFEKLKLSSGRGQKVTMFFIDLDDFKHTNDTYGYKAGDILLIEFGQIVKNVLIEHKPTSGDTKLVRLSGDEFLVVGINLYNSEIDMLAPQILKAFEQPLEIEGYTIKVNISIGSATETLSSANFDGLLKNADAAMYIAKNNGKNQYVSYSPNQIDPLSNDKKLERLITRAVQNKEFTLRFMPIFPFNNQMIKNVEVLLNIESPELQCMSITEFVRAAVKFSLIQDVDQWLLDQTFGLLAQNKALIDKLDIKFCINVSSLELHNDEYVPDIKAALNKYGIKSQQIELEINEAALTTDTENCVATLSALKELGFSLALDEFGSGNTALSQLVEYPVDKIKIGQYYVSRAGQDDKRADILIDMIIQLANSLDLDVTVVGIETLQQHYYFADKDCDYAEGFLFCEPLTFSELTRALRSQLDETQ